MPTARCAVAWWRTSLFAMSSPLFVKLGGSALTDKTRPETLNAPVLSAVAQTLAHFHATAPLLLGHGGGSFGHVWAARYATAQGITGPDSWWGVVRVADAMARLNRLVVQALIEAGLPAISLQPSASALACDGELQTLASEPAARLLAAHCVPVVYGDVVLDTAQGCAIVSTEAVFAALAARLLPRRMILVGEQAVYDADPRTSADARPIARIDRSNYAAVLELLGGSHGVDVTGGMRSKVAAMWSLASAIPGLEVVICGPDALDAALHAQPLPLGTVIAAS